jgi:hypothetical protein
MIGSWILSYYSTPKWLWNPATGGFERLARRAPGDLHQPLLLDLGDLSHVELSLDGVHLLHVAPRLRVQRRVLLDLGALVVAVVLPEGHALRHPSQHDQCHGHHDLHAIR